MKAILIRIEKLLIALLKEWRELNSCEKNARVPVVVDDIWLTKNAVMDLLCITESTFYRRLAECNWVRKKNGREWYYLKSSVI